MKFSILFVSLFLVSCSSDDEMNKASNPGLIGTWHHTENLLDPGDGSGTFQPVKSSKTLTFFADGTLESNGAICTTSSNTDKSSSGSYSTQDSTITTDCNIQSPFAIRFKVESRSLIISYPCIEPCRSKYKKQTN